MTKYSAKKIAVLVALGLAAFAIASFSFIDNAAAAAPAVETLAATEIFDESAQLNGTLFTGSENTDYWFEYGTSRSNLNQETTVRNVGDRDGRVTVSNTIRNGLTPGRTYYFRLIAENRDGIDRGDIRSFVADRESDDNNDNFDLTVRTLSAQTSGNSAVLNGSVESEANWVQVWFRYGRSSGSLDSLTQNLTIFGRADQDFSMQIYSLVPGATYYYQSIADNGEDVVRGQVLSFVAGGNGNGGGQTNGQAPIVSTNSATVTGRTSAVLRSQVNPNGTLSAVWFEYGRSAALGSVTTRDPAGSGNAFSQYAVNLNGLAAGTTYYFRAVAQSTAGVSRGQILSFRTEGVPPAPVNPGTNGGGNTGGNTAGTDNDDNDNEDADRPAPPISVVTSSPIGGPDCFTVTPTLSSNQLKANDEFVYSVTYRNNCGYALSNASLQITLPVATEFAGTNIAFLSRDANVITYNLGSVATNFQAAVTVNGKVRAQVNTVDSLVFQANVTFTNPNGVLQNASGFLNATIVEGGTEGSSGLAASALNALSGLFQSGWFWLVLFLILVALFVFWLATRRRDSADEEDEDEAGGVHDSHGEASGH